jgi:hypothetical protein
MVKWRERYAVLQVPPWVPDDVSFLVRDHWADQSGEPEQIALIERLLVDPRMEAVWHELTKHDRRTGDYSHLAEAMKMHLESARANEVFSASTAVVFQRAVVVGMSAMRINEQKCGRYLEQAAELRKDTELLRQMLKGHRLGTGSVDGVRRNAGQIEKAAEAYDRLRQLAEDGLFDGARSKGFVIEMAQTMRGLYGTALYGTVTTIAQVALNDQEITTAAVRAWCTP